MRVLIYARLSSSNDNSTSIERQLKACRDVADARGWTVAGEFIDDGVSGAVAPADRPAMGKLLAALPTADAVLAWKVDRLSRSLLDFSQLLKDAEAVRAAVVSCTETIDTTTAMGRAFAQLIAMFAELERGMMTERLANARAHLRNTNRHVSGRPPYGLKIVPSPDGKGKILARDAEAVAIIREVIRRLINGDTRNAIAEDLAARGVRSPREQTAIKPNPKPARWSGETIKVILAHPSLLGHKVDERGHVVRDADGIEVQYWEPVTSRETLARARAAIEARGFSAAPNSPRHWLSDAAVCGNCGRPLTQSTRKPYPTSPNAEPVMRCRGTAADRCKGVLVPISRLQEYVTTEFLSVVGNLPAVESVFIPGQDSRAELEAVEQAITRLRDDRDAGVFDDDEDDYRARVKALNARRRVLRDAPVVAPHWETRPIGKTAAELWHAADSDAARAELIRSMGVRCVVYSANRRRNVPMEDRAEFVPLEVLRELYGREFD